MSPNTQVSPAKYTARPPSSLITSPHASPRYSPSSLLEEWKAFTSVKWIPSISCVPPLLRPGRWPMFAPFEPSHVLSSTCATICTSGKACESATVSPTWSP